MFKMFFAKLYGNVHITKKNLRVHVKLDIIDNIDIKHTETEKIA